MTVPARRLQQQRDAAMAEVATLRRQIDRARYVVDEATIGWQLPRDVVRTLNIVLGVEEVPEDARPVIAEPFLGSVRLMNALRETAQAHTSFLEDDGDPYIWCSCGWRSDCPRGEEQASYLTHLSGALYDAVMDVTRELGLLRPTPSHE